MTDPAAPLASPGSDIGTGEALYSLKPRFAKRTALDAELQAVFGDEDLAPVARPHFRNKV